MQGRGQSRLRSDLHRERLNCLDRLKAKQQIGNAYYQPHPAQPQHYGRKSGYINVRDFKHSKVIAFTPAELLARM